MDDNRQFSVTKEEIGETAVLLTVVGRIDAVNSAVFERRLDQALKAGRVDITINMIGVRFLSSVGIRAVLNTFKKAKELGGTLRIVDPSENVKNVLGMTALDEMLQE